MDQLTHVQERQHGPRAPHTGRGFVVMWNSLFRSATGELVKFGKRLCVEGCNYWRVNLSCQNVNVRCIHIYVYIYIFGFCDYIF